jgi:hypothetical protein
MNLVENPSADLFRRYLLSSDGTTFPVKPCSDCGAFVAERIDGKITVDGTTILPAYKLSRDGAYCIPCAEKRKCSAPVARGMGVPEQFSAASVELARIIPKQRKIYANWPKMPHLFIFGKAGSGKTYAAYALAIRAGKEGRMVKMYDAINVAEKLRRAQAFSAKTESPAFNYPAMVLDNIGIEDCHLFIPWLFSFLDHRLSCRLPTILVSSLSTGQLVEKYGQNIISKLTMCAIVESKSTARTSSVCGDEEPSLE